MDSQDHCKSPGGKSHGAHVCTKCGWNYPNPHPSAKNRRAHKKICGTIKGFELLDSEKAKQNLDLQNEHCLDDEQKTPSPRVVEKADERIGDVSEEDVFTDAVCEFSGSVVSDSFKEKEETATNYAGETSKNLRETLQCDSSSAGCVMKSSEVVLESCGVTPVEVLENYDALNSVEAASDDRQGGERSTEGQSMASETLIESSQEAQVIDGGNTISYVGLETVGEGNLPDISESKLGSALGKRVTSDSSWNDEVIYSDLEGPHGFDLEATSMTYPGEVGCIVNETVPVDPSPVKANAAQVISTSQSVTDDIPFIENADVSLHGIKGLEAFEVDHSVNPCLPETSKGEECETDTLTKAENLGIQPEGLSIGTEVPSSDKVLIEDKIKPQGQTALVAVTELPYADNIMIAKIDPEDIAKKAEEGESSFGAAQETVDSETLRVSLPAVDLIVVDSNADVSHAAYKTGVVDLIDHESELVQANVVAEEGNSPNSKLSSESSCAAENYLSPVSVVSEGDYASNQRNSLTETSKDSGLQIGDLIDHESEIVQANVVAEEGNNPNSKLSSESSCAAENYLSPVSVVSEGDYASNQRNSLTETSKDSGLQIGDLIDHESEFVQANVVAEEGNNPNSKLSSESSCAAENYLSPVSVVSEGDYASNQSNSSTETSKDSGLQIGAESCKSNDEVCREINKGELVEESSFINVTNTKEHPISHSGATGTAPNDSFKTANQNYLESGRTEFRRVVGGLGVIQGNEIDSNVKSHNFYAEVPVTIESNDHRDFGRLQNLSEAHIRSLVSSPLVTRNNTSQAFESHMGSVSGLSGGVNKPENASQNQEITMERTTSWSTVKEQHVPLKNLLSEARSPKLQVEAKAHHESNMPRVSTILGQETSPEDSRWPERREVSEEWNSPAKYPVDLKREERKVKGRPFWVPFVCCSSVN